MREIFDFSCENLTRSPICVVTTPTPNCVVTTLLWRSTTARFVPHGQAGSEDKAATLRARWRTDDWPHADWSHPTHAACTLAGWLRKAVSRGLARCMAAALCQRCHTWPPSCQAGSYDALSACACAAAAGFEPVAHTTARRGRRRTQNDCRPGHRSTWARPAARMHSSRSTCRLCRACTCARSATPTWHSIGRNTTGDERMVLQPTAPR